jgi:hypothetical protein
MFLGITRIAVSELLNDKSNAGSFVAHEISNVQIKIPSITEINFFIRRSLFSRFLVNVANQKDN